MLSLPTCFFVLLYHSSCLLPAFFLLPPSYFLSLFGPCACSCIHARVYLHHGITPRHPRYHYRYTVANCPTTPLLFLRSTPSRTRYFVTVSLSSLSSLLRYSRSFVTLTALLLTNTVQKCRNEYSWRYICDNLPLSGTATRCRRVPPC